MQDSRVVEAFGILLANLLPMFVKKELNSITILSSTKISPSLKIIFLARFDDLSFVFPTSSFIVRHVFLASCLYLDIFSE